MKFILRSRFNTLSLPGVSLILLSIATAVHTVSFFSQKHRFSQLLVDEKIRVSSEEIKQSRSDTGTLDQLLSATSFGEKDDPVDQPVVKTNQSNLPDLPVKLVGVIASNSQRSAALLEINGAREVYVAGDKLRLDEDVRVKEVLSNYLVLDRLGYLQQLKMPEKNTLLEQGVYPAHSPRQSGTTIANTTDH